MKRLPVRCTKLITYCVIICKCSKPRGVAACSAVCGTQRWRVQLMSAEECGACSVTRVGRLVGSRLTVALCGSCMLVAGE
jgi:hypothetical protein